MNGLKNRIQVDSTLKYCFFAILVYSFFGLLFSIDQTQLWRVPQTLAVIILFYGLYQLFQNYLNSKKSTIVFTLFAIWSIALVAQIGSFSIETLRLALFDPYNLISYLIPLSFFATIRLNHVNTYAKWLVIYSLTFCIFHTIYLIKYPVNNFTDNIVVSSLPPIGLCLLCSRYVSKKYIYLAIICALFILAVGLLYGRRTIILVSILYLTFGFIFNVIANRSFSLNSKILFAIALAGLVFFGVDYFMNLSSNSLFQIINRLDTDSRSTVINDFVKDFQDMDYAFGRGMNGSFKNQVKYWNMTNNDFREVTDRINIENGYLYFILKGGIIYLGLFLSMALSSLYVAFFSSKNWFVKSLGGYILIYLIEMIAYGQPIVGIKYFLVWICIALCSNKKLRQLSDGEIDMAMIEKKKVQRNKLHRLKFEHEPM